MKCHMKDGVKNSTLKGHNVIQFNSEIFVNEMSSYENHTYSFLNLFWGLWRLIELNTCIDHLKGQKRPNQHEVFSNFKWCFGSKKILNHRFLFNCDLDCYELKTVKKYDQPMIS